MKSMELSDIGSDGGRLEDKTTSDPSRVLEVGPRSDGSSETLDPDHAAGSTSTANADISDPKASAAQESLWALVFYRLNDTLANALPPQTKADVHDLRKTGMAQLIALAFFFSYLFFLVYFSVNGYYQLREEAFLSPDIYSGECDEESISLTSTYTADVNGHWETEAGYVSTSSVYSLKLVGSQILSEDYPNIMAQFGTYLEAMGERCNHRDLSYCMLALANYNLHHAKTNMNFRADARAEKIFGDVVFDGAISDYFGTCVPADDVRPRAYYSAASDHIIFDVYFGPSSEGDPCYQINRNDFDTRAIDSRGYLQLFYDIRSISVAVAVNLGITSIKDDLVRVPFASGSYDGNGDFIETPYMNIFRYVDPAYDGMDPVLCFEGAAYNRADFCILEDETYYGLYPIVTQYGNWSDGAPCECGEDGLSNKAMNFYCSQEDFVFSLVYVPSHYWDYYTVYDLALELSDYRYFDPENGDLKIVERLHGAQIGSLGYGGYAYEDGSDPFIDLCYGYCTLFTVNIFGSGDGPMNFRGSPTFQMYENTQLNACSNGIYNAKAFNPLVEQPPVPLIQGYYTCVLNRTVAAQRSVGIAAGSAGLYSSLILSFLLFTSVFIYNRFASSKMHSVANKKKMLEDDVKLLKQQVQELIKQNECFAAEIRQLRKAQTTSSSI
jgi:hypothetical protein